MTETGDLSFLYEGSEIVGFVLSTVNSTNTYYYDKNPWGDIVALLDNSGNAVVKYRYDAYGNCEYYDSTDTELANANPIRYRSYYYDADTKLYYLEARYYTPDRYGMYRLYRSWCCVFICGRFFRQFSWLNIYKLA